MFFLTIIFNIYTFIFLPNFDFNTLADLSLGDWKEATQKRVAVMVDDTRRIALGKDVEAIMGEKIYTPPKLQENGFPIAALKVPIKATDNDFSTTAGSSVALESENETILFNKKADQSWPIASITKLVTALVFLDHNPGWDSIYEIKKDDRREGGKIYLYTGEKVKVKDLFYLSLVASGNTETVALVHSTGMDEKKFVEKMNEKVKVLGLKKTVFYDVVGLNDQNRSTAIEVAKFSKVALSKKEIAEATMTKKYDFKTQEGTRKIVDSTDELLDVQLPEGVKILGGKTGFNGKSGYCFVGKFIDSQRRQVISVILGDIDKSSRFKQTYKLVDWTYKNYRWQ